MSLSWLALHSGQVQLLMFNGILLDIYPHTEHRLDDGKNLSILTISRPLALPLYSNCLTSSPHETSAIAFASLWFFIMFFTCKSSIAIRSFSQTSFVVSLCEKSDRISAILAWIFATANLAFSRLREPFLHFESLRCALASWRLYFCVIFGLLDLKPSEVMIVSFIPRSMPICLCDVGNDVSTVSTLNDTKYLLAVSLLIVTFVGSLGRCLQRRPGR